MGVFGSHSIHLFISSPMGSSLFGPRPYPLLVVLFALEAHAFLFPPDPKLHEGNRAHPTSCASLAAEVPADLFIGTF